MKLKALKAISLLAMLFLVYAAYGDVSESSAALGYAFAGFMFGLWMGLAWAIEAMYKHIQGENADDSVVLATLKRILD